MAGPGISKARSEPRRVVPGAAGAGMVLLSKQDFDDLRSNALDLPRPLPMGGPVVQSALDQRAVKSAQGGTSLSMPATGAGGSSGSACQRRVTPKVERRVRSANGRRPPQPPGGGCFGQVDPIAPDCVSAKREVLLAKRAAPVAPDTSAVRKPVCMAQERQELSRQQAGLQVVQQLPRRQTPPPRQQKLLTQEPSAVGQPRRLTPPPRLQKLPKEGPLHVGNAIGRSRSESLQPTGRVPASSAPPLGSGLGLGVCGLDPRRLPRPADQVLHAVENGLISGVPIVAVSCKGKPEFINLNGVGLGLQVCGGAAPVIQSGVETDPPEFALPEEWSSSEGEEGCETEAEDDPDSFDYREYRYHRHQEARSRAAPPDPHRRGAKQRRPQACSQVRDESCESGCSQPWAKGESPSPRWAPDDAMPAASSASRGPAAARPPSRGSTPCCEEEPPDDEVRRIGEVLVKFYGLPGGVDRALRVKNNLVVVLDEAWTRREKRASQLTEPPMLWVRGGRVYDFVGDRGTVAEFGNDLLMRQVEDDAICRQRRREQGLMPYPFVAAPLKAREEDEEQADGDPALADGAQFGHRRPTAVGRGSNKQAFR